MASEAKAWRSPAAKVAAVAMACAVAPASSRIAEAAATAAPRKPTVPVVCQWR